MSDKGIEKIAKALVKSEAEQNLSDYEDKIRSKIQGEKAAREAIYRSVKAWTGFPPMESGQLPIVRDGKPVAYFSGSLAGSLSYGDEINSVARAVWSENTPSIRKRQAAYRKLMETLEAALDQISAMKEDTRANIFRLDKPGTDSLEEKLVLAMGSIPTVCTGSAYLIADLESAIARCEDELKTRSLGRGQPREEARYRVAEGFAKIFAKVTGERPTYSEDENGLHGKFSPALRDLFDAIGWKDADLEAPAKAACAAVESIDFEQGDNSTMGGIFGLPTDWTDKNQ